MSDPTDPPRAPSSPPIPAGPTGVLHRDQQVRASPPLTLEERWKYTVQQQRGFNSSSGGKQDAFRSQPATLPQGPLGGPKGVGAPVGKGFETFASIQIVTKDGQKVGLAADFFDGGGAENHGEARAIRGLENSAPARVEGGRMIVLTEKDPCSSCEQRLVAYARSRGIPEVEVYVPDRSSLTNPSVSVTPKQASRTSFQAGRPEVTIKPLRRIKVSGSSAVAAAESAAESAEPVFSARTAVVATIAKLGAAIALGILQQEFREKMLKDLENMPKPKIDKRAAEDYLSDPKTGQAIRLIDLFNKNLSPLAHDLADHLMKISGQVKAELMLVSLSSMSDEARLDFLSGLSEQLQIYGDQLWQMRMNVDAAQDLEPKALEAAKAAEDLFSLIDNRLTEEWLFRQGFQVEDIANMRDNLRSYSSRVRKVFRDLKELSGQVDACRSGQGELSSAISTISWQIIGARVRQQMKERGIQ